MIKMYPDVPKAGGEFTPKSIDNPTNTKRVFNKQDDDAEKLRKTSIFGEQKKGIDLSDPDQVSAFLREAMEKCKETKEQVNNYKS